MKNHTLFLTKMVKIYGLLQTKTAQKLKNHTDIHTPSPSTCMAGQVRQINSHSSLAVIIWYINYLKDKTKD